ncbi:ABC transporter permease [Pyrococcus furiosus DSM 3638]|uniref:ABC transporter permease n=4 Tax=Thermococcaceae TaxID=2259 RepID=A0A5C0XS45_PYRFU|nr:oligopeptide transport system permease protein [Pyrococcus furiosus DSM 3638]AFN03796.1 oligopeptide transport system permease [Pyrococcus furiosus COM1]MDK2870062.1 peptide/nickel transport system permease protein [Pyrococcus sp.]QEK78664.1 ABC transporter permease [Pyrococcus furiosus DSM 3638]
MKFPTKTLMKVAAVYACVFLAIILVAGITANRLTWEYVNEAVLTFQVKNPSFYEELKQNATREGITVEEYYYRLLAKAKGIRADNLLFMGIDLLRKSIAYYRENPKHDIIHATKVTLIVMGLAIALIIILALSLGFKLANSQYLGTVEGLARFFSGIPSWWVGAILLAVFAVKINIFPVGGLRSFPTEKGFLAFLDFLWHIILPIVTLVLIYVWEFTITVAYEVRNEIGKPYILTEKAKGLPEKVIYWKHVLKNVSIVLSSFTVQKFIEMFTDYIVIDVLFSLGGIGTLFKASFVRTVVPNVGVVISFDYRLFFVVALLISAISFILSLLLELLKGILDPRVS